MYVCIYICVCVIYDMNRTHIHINRYAYVRTQTHRHRHIMTHIFMYQCIYDDICIYIYTYVFKLIYIFTHDVCGCVHCNYRFLASVCWCPVAGLDENALRDTFRVEFIAPDGSVESGVDGGGLFKARFSVVILEIPPM